MQHRKVGADSSENEEPLSSRPSTTPSSGRLQPRTSADNHRRQISLGSRWIFLFASLLVFVLVLVRGSSNLYSSEEESENSIEETRIFAELSSELKRYQERTHKLTAENSELKRYQERTQKLTAENLALKDQLDHIKSESMVREIKLTDELKTVKAQLNEVAISMPTEEPETKPEESSSATVLRYHQLKDKIQQAIQHLDVRDVPMRTAFTKATLVQRADPWFVPKTICNVTCCATPVAVSLNQDDHHIVNTLAGSDLADTLIKHYPIQNHQHYVKLFGIGGTGGSLDEDLLPCLQPGTLIHLDNHVKSIHYFWARLRPNITVPFVLLSSESDADNPDDVYTHYARKLKTDPLLIKWYGINPDRSVSERYNATHKFEGIPLGLSKHHPQSVWLSSYLELTRYKNPFLDKSRWISGLGKEGDSRAAKQREFSTSIFVMFSVHKWSQHRQALFDLLCLNSTQKHSMDNISCSYDTTGVKHSIHDLYSAASKYHFGLSPPGMGWDCYRTYELLLLGVIPIIQERPGSRELYKDLPVIHLPDLIGTAMYEKGTDRPQRNWTQEELVQVARDYVHSDEFQQNNFTGWDRLFLRYWRRKLLHDSGRDKDILQDEQGREYYQAWQYTHKVGKEPLFCNEKGKCLSSAYIEL